eukprot:jgi/Hompol1/4134/HPOL_006937-RA
MKKWGNIVRRHLATKSPLAETIQAQFSGYGANLALVTRFLDKFEVKTPIETWTNDDVSKMALNKIDLPDSDRNIDKITRKYGQDKLVLTSALAETFLRKLHKQRFINYHEGTDFIEIADDQTDPAPDVALKALDDKTKQ